METTQTVPEDNDLDDEQIAAVLNGLDDANYRVACRTKRTVRELPGVRPGRQNGTADRRQALMANPNLTSVV